MRNIPGEPSSGAEALRPGPALVALIVAFRIALPLVTIDPTWEFHRDEFLYFAMGDHFHLFGMQFPPLIAALARISKAIFGDDVLAARAPAALAGAAVMGAMVVLAIRLGAGRWAVILIALASVAAPALLRTSVLFHPVVFDQLWCLLAVAGAVLAAAERNPRWWLLTGVALGLGALTKFSAAFYGVSLALPVLLIPELRRQLATRWPWLGAGLAALLATPSITGQVVNHWPFLGQMQSLRAQQLEHVAPLQFLLTQPLLLGAASVLVIAGLLAAIRGDVPARVAGLFAVALVGLMLVMNGKAYYAAPGYPALIALGALELQRRGRVVKTAIPAFVAVGAMVLLPMGIPVFAPEEMARYAHRIGVSAAIRTNRSEVLTLPQDYADMLGWRRQAEAAARVWRTLTPAEQADGILAGSNYGEAGALAMYHQRLGLPYPVASTGISTPGVSGRGAAS